MKVCARSQRVLSRAVLYTALTLAILLPRLVFAQQHPSPIPGPAECAALMQAYERAIQARHYTLAHQLGQQLVKAGCYKPPPGPIGKACSAGIKSIASFLQTCPPADAAYTTILHDFAISYDGTPLNQQTLTQDLNAVCANIIHPASTPLTSLKQKAEHTVTQVLRTMYYMDNQGVRDCAYPWTGGTSLYAWEKSMIAGVDIRDDSAYSDCCEVSGVNYVIAIKEMAADQYPFDFTWTGIANQMALYVHEARHSPRNLPPPNTLFTFLHSTCCPEQGNSVTASCDDTYNESDLSPYGSQYWLFRAWLQGTINVGYACMAPADVQATSQFFQGAADGYIGRFCNNPPPFVSLPTTPGGPCP